MKRIILVLLVFSLFLVVFIAPFASEKPDGLERVALDKKFDHNENSKISSPFSDYTISFIKNERVSTALSGILGILVTFGFVYIIGILIRRKTNAKP